MKAKQKAAPVPHRHYSSCSYCGSSVDEQHIRVEMWFGDTLTVFENVPAGVCDNCGEEYILADIQDKMIALSKTDPIRKLAVPVYSFADPLTVAKAAARSKKREEEREQEAPEDSAYQLASDEELSDLMETDIVDWEEKDEA
jgi:YgiT-type zinc finger domain-containing protein